MARIGLQRREFLRAAGILGATAATVGWQEAVGAVAGQQPSRGPLGSSRSRT